MRHALCMYRLLSSYDRDECFQCLQQLQAIKKGTVALMTGRTAAPSGESDPVRESLAPTHVVERAMETASGKSSPVSMTSVAPTPLPQSDAEAAASSNSVATKTVATPASSGDAMTDAVAPPVATVVRRVPERDMLLDEYELILDEVVAMRCVTLS